MPQIPDGRSQLGAQEAKRGLSPSPPTAAQGVTVCSRPSSGGHAKSSPWPGFASSRRVCTGCRSGGVSRGCPSSLAPGVPHEPGGAQEPVRAPAPGEHVEGTSPPNLQNCPRIAFSSAPPDAPRGAAHRLWPQDQRHPLLLSPKVTSVLLTVPSRVALPSQRPRSLSDGEARGQPADKQASLWP